jgi:hypothetical protein
LSHKRKQLLFLKRLRKQLYQRANYEGPMREAWRLLSERLDLLVSKPDNVLVLRRAA